MTQVVISPQAQWDIYDVWGYISQNNESAGDRWIESVKERCTVLAEHPRLGPARHDIGKDIRYLPMGSYVIVYRETVDTIEIVRIVHGARNLEAIFHSDEQ